MLIWKKKRSHVLHDCVDDRRYEADDCYCWNGDDDLFLRLLHLLQFLLIIEFVDDDDGGLFRRLVAAAAAVAGDRGRVAVVLWMMPLMMQMEKGEKDFCPLLLLMLQLLQLMVLAIRLLEYVVAVVVRKSETADALVVVVLL